MPGPTPKPASQRARRNKTSTAATFETEEQPITEAPELGAHPAGEEWHERTLDFWREVWDSPMAEEFLRADVDGLLELAVLVDGFWKKPDAKLAAEIRLQRQCYGLTPIDRRRLQWEISRAEKAERGRKPPAQPTPSGDPRAALRAV